MTATDESDVDNDVRASDLTDRETGRPRVLGQKCDTCIYRPGNLMHLRPGALAQITEDARDSFITCHDTLPSVAADGVRPAMCRGWFDGHGENSPVVRTLRMLFGEPVEVEPPHAGNA